MVDRVIFEIKFFDAESGAEPVGAHQRGEAGIQTDARLAVDRQQFAITPQVGLARSDLFPTYCSFDSIVIVLYLQRTEAGLADVERLLGIFLATFTTLQSFDKAHGVSFLRRHISSFPTDPVLSFSPRRKQHIGDFS